MSKKHKAGILYWLTGLSGAGKTTIGRQLYALLKKEDHGVVFLDGDVLREVFGSRHGYTPETRRKLALRYCHLCKVLTDQGIDVVCATISLFEDCWKWNRKHIPGYKEIYIRVPMKILHQRDQKQLYSRALKGEVKCVMGVDIPFCEPHHPDLVIDNVGEKTPAALANLIYRTMAKRKSHATR